ncbi:hypothetical protein C731_2796 [Mycolicibacterium hassiacum DSM 44199]|jgi:hypothetical protein|uniref:Uncharacterized protein n=1 Tax=Mycolicibacterium hassiacum (strain DSM 44199 / CIP 105218 / JCM 12690 / 3849) TaxID=1122247 RepID=K5BEQ0_MYCHD|nr:hypothetical protein [Mycolicibacterium hassiacum]EKF23192.1 hypothetical protein C731_2796 [Mycolicibacterium hassiacum DSM 44199]MBX5485776.1 hypothetical protein [Mycolicibacterium hassiacum]MDA4085538.1 hypothetical protein [Mycolicibacterium hassiacum DSM 44199]PZN15002.1 MAG: hypothetical protein DIU75_21035 [Mycolicibacterium hassiacum]VCT89678.1 hypothetical protein MHAS_01374 [Mycolicibacterium hassiacum DSM 44199]
MELSERLGAVLDDALAVEREPDGAVTVRHGGTIASLRVVPVTEGLELVSLTQMLAWDLPLTAGLRNAVADHAQATQLGTVSLVAKTPAAAAGGRRSRKVADVLLRYNFPAAGLSDEALRTLILMVLATGVQVRRALVGEQA